MTYNIDLESLEKTFQDIREADSANARDVILAEIESVDLKTGNKNEISKHLYIISQMAIRANLNNKDYQIVATAINKVAELSTDAKHLENELKTAVKGKVKNTAMDFADDVIRSVPALKMAFGIGKTAIGGYKAIKNKSQLNKENDKKNAINELKEQNGVKSNARPKSTRGISRNEKFAIKEQREEDRQQLGEQHDETVELLTDIRDTLLINNDKISKSGLLSEGSGGSLAEAAIAAAAAKVALSKDGSSKDKPSAKGGKRGILGKLGKSIPFVGGAIAGLTTMASDADIDAVDLAVGALSARELLGGRGDKEKVGKTKPSKFSKVGKYAKNGAKNIVGMGGNLIKGTPVGKVAGGIALLGGHIGKLGTKITSLVPKFGAMSKSIAPLATSIKGLSGKALSRIPLLGQAIGVVDGALTNQKTNEMGIFDAISGKLFVRQMRALNNGESTDNKLSSGLDSLLFGKDKDGNSKNTLGGWLFDKFNSNDDINDEIKFRNDIRSSLSKKWSEKYGDAEQSRLLAMYDTGNMTRAKLTKNASKLGINSNELHGKSLAEIVHLMDKQREKNRNSKDIKRDNIKAEFYAESLKSLKKDNPDINVNIAGSTTGGINVRYNTDNIANSSTPKTSQVIDSNFSSQLTEKINSDIASQTQQAINRGVKYGFGDKNSRMGSIDCSGWVAEINKNMIESIDNGLTDATSKKSAKRLFEGGAAGTIRNFENAGAKVLSNKDLTLETLKDGMIIGEDNGRKGWDTGRHRGIDHIVQVYIDPKTGKMMVTQSSSKKGVNKMSAEDYLANRKRRGVSMFGVDANKTISGKLGMKSANVGQVAGTVKDTGNASLLKQVLYDGESKGNYNIVNRGAKHGYKASTKFKLTDKTINQVLENQNKGVYKAAGAYQIIPSTLKSAMRSMGLTGDELFDKNMQDKIYANYLAKTKRSDIKKYITGKHDDVNSATTALAKEWASMPVPHTMKGQKRMVGKGQSYYAGDGINKAHVSADRTINALREARKQYERNIKAGMTPQQAYESALLYKDGDKLMAMAKQKTAESNKVKLEKAVNAKANRDNIAERANKAADKPTQVVQPVVINNNSNKTQKDKAENTTKSDMSVRNPDSVITAWQIQNIGKSVNG